MRARKIAIATMVALVTVGVARTEAPARASAPTDAEALARPEAPAPAPASARAIPRHVRDALGPSADIGPDGLYRITLPSGDVLDTHGPDPAPDHGSSMGPGDPERDPICATDYYIHVLYGRPSGASNRLTTVRPQIISAIRRMNAVLNEEALESGDRTADYKVLCETNGTIKIDAFTSTGNDFQTIATSAQAAGFLDARADYSIFYDASGGNVCGIANISSDDSLSENNANNTGRDYAITYEPCWDGRTPMHENGHNQGAVQYDAPDSTGSGGHCNDVYDIMCYSPDGGDKNQGGTVLACVDRMHFDCGHDTYFDAAPEQGEWLATHWNIGAHLNRFIVFDGSGGGSNVAPDAAFSATCDERVCTFTDASSDTDGWIASRAWSFGDGGTSTAPIETHTYAQTGAYDVTLTVTDDRGAISSTVQRVVTPTVPVINQPVYNSTVQGPDVTISGTGSPTATLSLTLDGATAFATVTSEAGAWTIRLSLLGGNHSVVARSSSSAGTSPPSPTRAFLVEDPPRVDPTVTSPTPGQITWPTPTVAGNAQGASRVQIRLDNQVIARFAIGSDGDFSHGFSTTGGTHTVIVDAESSAGLNIGSSAPVTFTVDAIRPTLRLDPVEALTFSPLVLTGTARDDLSLRRVVARATNQVTGARSAAVEATLGAPGADGWTPWTVSMPGLTPGRYVIEVHAEDHVGLRSLTSTTTTIIL